MRKDRTVPASVIGLALGRPWNHIRCNNARVLTLSSMNSGFCQFGLKVHQKQTKIFKVKRRNATKTWLKVMTSSFESLYLSTI